MMHCMSPCGIALLYQLYYCFILIYWLLSFPLVCVLPRNFFSWHCSPIAVGSSFFNITLWELILIFMQYLFLFPDASGVINFPCLLYRCSLVFFQWNLIKNDMFTYRYGVKLGEYLDILYSKVGKCLNTQKPDFSGYTEPEQYLVSGIGKDRKKAVLEEKMPLHCVNEMTVLGFVTAATASYCRVCASIAWHPSTTMRSCWKNNMSLHASLLRHEWHVDST